MNNDDNNDTDDNDDNNDNCDLNDFRNSNTTLILEQSQNRTTSQIEDMKTLNFAARLACRETSTKKNFEILIRLFVDNSNLYNNNNGNNIKNDYDNNYYHEISQCCTTLNNVAWR